MEQKVEALNRKVKQIAVEEVATKLKRNYQIFQYVDIQNSQHENAQIGHVLYVEHIYYKNTYSRSLPIVTRIKSLSTISGKLDVKTTPTGKGQVRR
jgi:hypothetical protein